MQHSIKAVALLLGLTAAAGTADAASSSAASKIGHFTLANGLQVVVIPDHRAPVVTHMIWYRVGAADEAPGRSGIAHFLEHLLFKGTAKHPGDTFSQTVARYGGRENAFTSSDYTGYFQRVAREHLRTMMELEADRITGLILTDDVVAPELNVVLEERSQRVENNPGARLSEQMEAALYLNHPYGRPVIGWRHEMEKMTRADAEAFYARYYTPSNAVVVIAGDVTVDEVKGLAEETYGKVARRGDSSLRPRPVEPPPAAARTVTLADPRVTEPAVRRAYLVPSIITAQPGESEALDVLAQILGGSGNSRLYRTLVVDKTIATTASAWYVGSSREATQFSLYASPKPGHSLTELEAAVDAVIADIVENGITADELERATNRLVADTVYAQDSQSSLARMYGSLIVIGMGVDAITEWPNRIRKVTAEQVRDVARRWLDKERSVTGYLVEKQEKRS